MTLETLRAFAVSRSLFEPLSLKRTIEKLGFVQTDPIRAPARAQDLTLRHRARRYRAGDLERRYSTLDIEEDVFINYGVVSRGVHALMHPREKLHPAGGRHRRRDRVLAFVRDRGEVHPREVDAHFAFGRVTNYWGGSSSATTHLMEDLHYRGWLRVVRREQGIRIYARREAGAEEDRLSPPERVDALVDVVVNVYAPLPAASLAFVVSRLRYAVPQCRELLKDALARARQRLASARVDGIDWYWPAHERPERAAVDDAVRFLAPFDPVVWDRRRFELFWGWPYRFEAYTPAPKRRFGYYALPMLWRDSVIGWANLPPVDGTVKPDLGWVGGRPRDRNFAGALDAELERLRWFLRIDDDLRE